MLKIINNGVNLDELSNYSSWCGTLTLLVFYGTVPYCIENKNQNRDDRNLRTYVHIPSIILALRYRYCTVPYRTMKDVYVGCYLLFVRTNSN